MLYSIISLIKKQNLFENEYQSQNLDKRQPPNTFQQSYPKYQQNPIKYPTQSYNSMNQYSALQPSSAFYNEAISVQPQISSIPSIPETSHSSVPYSY